MNEAEMIDDITGYYLPPGIKRTYSDAGWKICAVSTSGMVLALLCELTRFNKSKNHIGEDLKTLHEKCREYHNSKVRLIKSEEARDLEQAIQLIKDL